MDRRRIFIKYANVPDDAISEHGFNCAQIVNLETILQKIKDFQQTQKKGAEFPTQKEQNLKDILAENRILWPIVREDVISLDILTTDQIDLLDHQVEFKRFKNINEAKYFLERQLNNTKEFLSMYEGTNPAFLQMQTTLHITPESRKR